MRIGLGVLRALLCVSALLFLGCDSFFSRGYKGDIVADKKMQASRKDAILKDKKVLLTAVVTYLNEVSKSYSNREYFFVELYNEQNLDYSDSIEYTLNDKKPLWVREIKNNEFDEILHPDNKWSRCYLVAFDSISELDLRQMLLVMEVGRVGVMKFNFSIKILPLKM